MRTLSYSVLAAFGLVLVSVGAQAQHANNADAADQNNATKDTASLAEWQYNSIYEAGGLRAEALINQDVFSAEGFSSNRNKIGTVENAIINAKGQIVALILEVGDHWGMPDTHVVVPWKAVSLIPAGVRAPVSEDNYKKYLLFSDNSFVTLDKLQKNHPVDDILATGARTWKLTALLDDYVILQGAAGFGYLDDAIFSMNGRILALIVQSSVAAYGFGAYAVPYYGPSSGQWQPYDNVYTLPYGSEAIKNLDSFDYGHFQGLWH